ncbi:hypothetical protein RHSIM_RhsimUnG0136700 [Rhododendron simsii]|uniref:Uncharacterized protein n=1 Tax=Rhododendron simsii TaxID=118357 RepID=A0A834FVW3_RHOSS|nr:hypothetical protein RHSIM_RhsimUnG0136700 [Rhododendron simsii]
MYSSSTCIDESTTSDSLSLSPPSPLLSQAPKSPESPCRVGSGTSVILDSENSVEAESKKLPSSRFKGVVPQPNGRWGAQIYEKHQRVWLGTFVEQGEAARAYDTAAQRFRGRDAVTNVKPLSPENPDDAAELTFLNSHSKAEIVDMLRKHTYNEELEQSRRKHEVDTNGKRLDNNARISHILGGADKLWKSTRQLFEKSVTPSDVGKLNRLVIPKQHAEKHFPLQSCCSSGSAFSSSSKGLLLNFKDVTGKVWRFRYSYWNSSQSYVLTKGWSRFVKEKNLKAGDVVGFHRSSEPDQQLFIDWKAKAGSGSGGVSEPVQMVRLFGVNIFQVPGSGSCGGKRDRDVELLAFEWSKKSRVIGAL